MQTTLACPDIESAANINTPGATPSAAVRRWRDYQGRAELFVPYLARVESLRRHLSMTVEEIASAMGVTARTYRIWQAGKRLPSCSPLPAIRLSRATGASIGWLFEGEDRDGDPERETPYDVDRRPMKRRFRLIEGGRTDG